MHMSEGEEGNQRQSETEYVCFAPTILFTFLYCSSPVPVDTAESNLWAQGWNPNKANLKTKRGLHLYTLHFEIPPLVRTSVLSLEPPKLAESSRTCVHFFGDWWFHFWLLAPVYFCFLFSSCALPASHVWILNSTARWLFIFPNPVLLWNMK